MATTTVSDVLTDARYDLGDFGKQKWDDTYLIKMLNRGVRVLERELTRINSNLNIRSTSGTLVAANNYITVDKTVEDVLYAYVNTNDDLYKKSLDWLYRYRIEVVGSNTGPPHYYGVWGKPATASGGRKIEFDYYADQNYTVYYVYRYLTGDLIITDYMPYDDMFNDYLREGVVVLAQKTKDNNIVNVDQVWRELFRNRLHGFNLAISYIPTIRRLDF